jgi:ribonuclease T2
MKKLHWFIRVMFILFLPSVISATVPMEGYLIADKECPAYQSIKKETNPGEVMLQSGYAYEITGKNKPNATHYQVLIDQAQPKSRWVEISCGKALYDCKAAEGIPAGPEAAEYVFAISWQPAFCQTHQSKAECQTQTSDRYDADHFTLHGLWPQPRGNDYCNVPSIDKNLDKSGAWDRLPALGLSDTTYADLLIVMPGVASYLQRHEWIKHGTCYGEPAETYFREAMALLNQINESVVREHFAGNIGHTITAQTIRSKFDEAFGAGSGAKVKISCSGGMITELQIRLEGDITEQTPVNNLLMNAENIGAGCSQGKVDAVGF